MSPRLIVSRTRGRVCGQPAGGQLGFSLCRFRGRQGLTCLPTPGQVGGRVRGFAARARPHRTEAGGVSRISAAALCP